MKTKHQQVRRNYVMWPQVFNFYVTYRPEENLNRLLLKHSPGKTVLILDGFYTRACSSYTESFGAI